MFSHTGCGDNDIISLAQAEGSKLNLSAQDNSTHFAPQKRCLIFFDAPPVEEASYDADAAGSDDPFRWGLKAFVDDLAAIDEGRAA